MKLRPQRDEYGSVLIPGRVLLHAADVVPSAADGPHLPVTGEGLLALRPGSRLRFRDARGARRSLCVVSREPEGVWAQTRRTCYFVEGIELAAVKSAEARRFIVTALPPRPGEISLHPGDPLLLCRSEQPGVPVKRGPGGEVLAPAQIGCTLPRALDGLAAGQRVLFDDGRIAGVVQQVDAAAARIQITRTRPGGSKLRSDKGINLPDTPLDIAPLTEKDLADLPFIGRHADAVALSFANSPCDVRTLIDAIRRLGAGSPAIVIKVESRRGFENLPAMLLEAMRTGPCAVMIARGDLAVECGFERLAELQEEILWICEAAHVPVIWATQVLETLAKEGLPSRAEITDAAMGDRAECVMLNKGPHIVRAVQTLADILNRMHAHQWKKRAMLRGLRLAHLFFAPHGHEPSAHCG
jgi:pyruvate kinase